MGRGFIRESGAASGIFEGQELLDRCAPPQLTASQDNFSSSASGFKNCSFLELSSNAAINLNGLQGGKANRELTLLNTGAYTITLVNQASTSAAANQFYLAGGSNVAITSGSAVTLLYSSTLGGWTVSGSSSGSGGGGGGGTVTSVGIASTNLVVSGTVTTSGDLNVALSSTQVNDLSLAATALQPIFGLGGSYTSTNLTINSEGQITAASSGGGGGGSITTVESTDGTLTITGGTGPTVNIKVKFFTDASTQLNPLVGVGAGANINTSALGSVALGYNALGGGSTGTTGASNTAIGSLALAALTSGAANTVIGYDSGALITTGGGNTIVGKTSGSALTTASDNTIVGATAGTQLTTGANNTVIGFSVASSTLATGSDNVLIGVSSASDTATSSTSNAVIVGVGAKGGSNDVAVGYYASGGTSQDGNFNTAIGTGALQNQTTGQYNVAVGAQALLSSTVYGSNTAIGYQSLYYVTAGQYNTALGYRAGYATQQAGANVAIGYNAMGNNNLSDGSNNVAVGAYALKNNNGGSYNVAIGFEVAQATLQSGGSNVLIGCNSQIDTAAANTSNTIQIGTSSTAIWSATGCGTPSTSATVIAGTFGINGVTGPAQLTGWGNPVGAGVIGSYTASTATLSSTATVVAQLITTLKALGIYGI